jgi:hypothetical protein
VNQGDGASRHRPVADDLEQGGAYVAEFGDQPLRVWGGYNTGLFTTGTTTTEPPLVPYQPLRTEMVAMWGDAVAPEPDTAAPSSWNWPHCRTRPGG